MSVGPRLGKISESMSFRLQRCLWGQADAKVEEQREQQRERERERKCLLGALGYSGHILQYWVESWEISSILLKHGGYL